MDMETPETRLTYIAIFANAIAHTMSMQRDRAVPLTWIPTFGQEERMELQGGVRG